MRSGYGLTPTIKYRRNKFNLSHGVKTTMGVGKLYPLDLMEVYAGDTFNVKNNFVSRVTSSFIRPVMDNIMLDTYSFFVPYRLLFDDYEKVFGNPNPSAYYEDNRASFPVFNAPIHITKGTVGDYLGLPLGDLPEGVSVLPFRAFALIYDKWFRNENVTSEVYVHRGASLENNPNNGDFSPSNYTGKCPRITRKKDYFSTCLPQPQKGSPVALPLGEVANVKAVLPTDETRTPFEVWTSNNTPDSGALGVGLEGWAGTNPDSSFASASGSFLSLVADLNNATAVNVNDLRLAFQLQKMLELDARAGTRINEYYSAHFGVENPDSSLQIPVFLGGSSTPINVQQVAQTSAGTTENPLGQLAGYSLTNGKHRYVKSFTEHGYIITVGCIRAVHTYTQGVAKLWTRKEREDFYDPLFAHIGEQPVYTSELYAKGQESLKGDIFGYQEAFSELRVLPNRATSSMRGSEELGQIWTFADNFTQKPVLNEGFIRENEKNVTRTMSYTENNEAFLVDIYSNIECTRAMPLYGVPGRIDH